MTRNGGVVYGVRPKLGITKIAKTAGFISLLLVAAAVHPYAPQIVVLLLAARSLLGSKNAIQALSLVVIIKFLNPAIYHFANSFALCAWATIGVAGLRIFYDHFVARNKWHPVLSWLFLYALAVIITSLFFSHSPSVSILKVTAFAFAASAILLGFELTTNRSVDWTAWFLGLWLAVVTLSLPTLFVHDIGYHLNGRGFQGILNHPQAFGTFLAPAVAWVTATSLFSSSVRINWMSFVAATTWSLTFLTKARTAIIAVFAGLLAVSFAALLRLPKWRKRIQKAALNPITVVAALAILSLALFQPTLIVDPIRSFISKNQDQATIGDSFYASRGQGIQVEWQNFIKYPFFGIGFGVSLDKSFAPRFDPTTGLPISAPVEKGFLPTAVLEETGLVGAIFFSLFMISFFRLGFSRNLALSWMFTTTFFINVGEMAFFSVNGLGLYMLLLMGWATSEYWKIRRAT